MKALLFALLLIGSTAHAAGFDALVTAGIGEDFLGHKPFERYGALGVQYGGAWKVRANGGYWLALAEGEKSSAFGSVQGGLEVVGQGGLFAEIMIGPALIAQPDSKLAGNFQFHLSAMFGVRDSAGRRLGLQRIHFSNAGIVQPNHGRDLWTLGIMIPLGKGS